MQRTHKEERIAIIAPANLKYMPYAQNYLSQLGALGSRLHVLAWDKRGLDEADATWAFHFKAADSNRKRMFLGHWLFARKCRAYIRRHKITKLIILTAAPAFFLGTGFLKKFTGKYILDIRDDSPLVRRFPETFRKICVMATQVVTSSPLFNEWIPADTLMCHNADITQIKNRQQDLPRQKCNHPISLVFAGMLNEGKINFDMIRHLGRDDRFRFAFIGSECSGKEAIRQFSQEQGLENIIFQGTYSKDEIYDIYRENADLVNIIRTKSTVNRNALPNKLYDAVLAGVPVVVFDHNEAVGNYVRRYHLGLVLEEKMETLGDTIVQEMASFDYSTYAAGRIAFLKKIEADMEQFVQLLDRFAAI